MENMDTKGCWFRLAEEALKGKGACTALGLGVRATQAQALRGAGSLNLLAYC